MPNITVRWANPYTTTASSLFGINLTYFASGTCLDSASKMATSPYASPSAVLAASVSKYASSLTLNNSSSFAASGYVVFEDALVGYGANSGTVLSNASWLSGYGSYASNTSIYQAHESASFNVIETDTYYLFGIVHTDKNGNLSPQTDIPYYTPRPGTSLTCKVIVVAISSNGDVVPGLNCTCTMNTAKPFLIIDGRYVYNDIQTVTTDTMGYAEFTCFTNAAVEEAGGGTALGYIFSIGGKTINAPIIPSEQFALLKDIAVA